MRRSFVMAAVIVLAASAAAAAALGATAPPPHVAEAASAFPSRAYILTLPHGMKLKADAVQVFENGRQANDLTVTPVGESRSTQFGAVLVIDASTSMEGAPEQAAFGAARAFAAQRKGQEQLAIVTYNVSPSVKLPFTTDQTRIDAALSTQPPFVFGTHIYDAIGQSLDLLRNGHISAGTIVILSDGQEHRGRGDRGDHESEATMAAKARAAHVRVFSVGLRSRVSNLKALRTIARDTGGQYIETTSIKELKAIYKQLGSTLASEYLLRYRSLAGPNQHIAVTIRVHGVKGKASVAYDTPKLAIGKRAAARPYKRSIADRILSSPLTMTLVSLIAAALIGFAVVSLLSGPKKGTVRKRLAEFVSIPAAIDESKRATAQLTGAMFEGTENVLRGSSRWKKFKWELQVAKIKMPAEQIVVLTAVGSLLALLLINVVTGSLLVSVVIAAVIPLAVRNLLKRALAKQRKLFSEQLPDNLQVLASALRAGHSFIGALSVVVNDAPEPARSEFQRVVADEQLGVPIDQALDVVVQRMDSRELEQVALVAGLQRETGGNTAEVLDRVTDTIRERFELRRTVQTLTAQGRMSRWVLTFLPLFLLLVITLINPGYMNIMYHTTGGRMVLVFAGISVASGSLVIKKIVNIKV
ncbi:MAG: VWA domain-containing protein [Actinobacteria bacterium]|nr:MAG: VWA domain-containing protein [Actinomycetota bacterium]